MQARLLTEELLDGIVDPAALANEFANGTICHSGSNRTRELGTSGGVGAALVLPLHMRHLHTDQLHVSIRSNASSAPVLEDTAFNEYAAETYASGTVAAGTAAALDAASAAEFDVASAMAAGGEGGYECARVPRDDGSGRFMLLPERSQPHGHRSSANRPGGQVRRPATPAVLPTSGQSKKAASKSAASPAPTPRETRFASTEPLTFMDVSGSRLAPPPPAAAAVPRRRPGTAAAASKPAPSASVVPEVPAGRAEADLLNRAAMLLQANGVTAVVPSRPGTAASVTTTVGSSANAAGGRDSAKVPLNGKGRGGSGRGGSGRGGSARGDNGRTAPTKGFKSAAEQLVATAARVGGPSVAAEGVAVAAAPPQLPPRSTPKATGRPGSSSAVDAAAAVGVRASAEAKASAQSKAVAEDPLDRLAAVDAALLATAFAAACGPDLTMPLASLVATLRRAGVPGVEALVPTDGMMTALTGHVALRYEEVVAVAEKLRIMAARQTGVCAPAAVSAAAASAASAAATSSKAAVALLPAEARVRLSRAFALECDTATCQLPNNKLHTALLGGGMDVDAAAVRAAAAEAPALLEWHDFLAIAAQLAMTHGAATAAVPRPSSKREAVAAPPPSSRAPPTADSSCNSRPSTAFAGRLDDSRPLTGAGYDSRPRTCAGYHEGAVFADDPAAWDVKAAAAAEAAAGDATAAAARAVESGIDVAAAIRGDLIIAAHELRLERKPRSRLIAHLCATTAAAVGEPAPATRRSEAFPVSDRISPINLAIVATASRALSLALEAYPAAESLLGEVSAARLQQAARLALAHRSPAIVAVPLSDSVSGVVRGELLLAVAPPAVAPPALLGIGTATHAASASGTEIRIGTITGSDDGQRPSSGPSQQRGYDYLCVDSTYDGRVGRGAYQGAGGDGAHASRRIRS